MKVGCARHYVVVGLDCACLVEIVFVVLLVRLLVVISWLVI